MERIKKETLDFHQSLKLSIDEAWKEEIPISRGPPKRQRLHPGYQQMLDKKKELLQQEIEELGAQAIPFHHYA